MPKISVVTPVFNSRSFIEAAIDSVVGQGYPDLEYIVIDGGSTDGTVDVLRKYDAYITYWESTKDRGQTHALNKGFQHATGTLRGWLNADEEYLPGALLEVGQAYHSEGEPDLIYGDRYFADLTVSPPTRTLARIPPIPPLQLTLFTGRILWSDATFWSKRVHDQLGELDEARYPRYAMDVEWLLRVAGEARNSKYVPIPLSLFKYHGLNITAEGLRKGLRYNEQIRRDFARDRGVSLLALTLGWFWFSVRLRLWERGPAGLLRMPRKDTVLSLFGGTKAGASNVTIGRG